MSKAVTQKEVEKIAHLSKLNLEGNELENLTLDFNNILQFVKKIDEVNTDNIPTFDNVQDLTNCFREDTPHESLENQDLKNIAPQYKKNFIVVPQIIEK